MNKMASSDMAIKRDGAERKQEQIKVSIRSGIFFNFFPQMLVDIFINSIRWLQEQIATQKKKKT